MSEPVSETEIIPIEALEELTPGERLRAAREGRGESLKEVAARTHQSIDTLKALEAMDTDRLSATVVRMHATRYAQALGLSGQEIADAYAASRTMMKVEATPQKRTAKAGMLPKVAIAGIALCGLGLAAFGVVTLMSGERTKSETIPVSTRLIPSTTAVSAQNNQRALATVKSELAIRAMQNAWIEVRASDGTIFRSREMSRGEVYYPRLQAGWTMTVRNGAAFEVVIDGQGVMPLGETASPLYSLSIDTLAERAEIARQQMIAEAAKENAAQSR